MNTLKDSFEFNKVICEQNSDLYMASLDVDSFFTNVLLDETIAICTQGLFESESTVYVLNKKEFTEMLSLTTKESIILFHKEFYSQIDTVAMGSPFGPILANLFLCHHEKKWLNNFLIISNLFFIRDTLMTYSSCLKNLNMFNFLLTT